MVFLVTDDGRFEDTVIEAVLDHRYGVRHARGFHAACELLGHGTGDILFAIVDLDLQAPGRVLLHGLGSFPHDFPIIAVASDPDAFRAGRGLVPDAAEYMLKPLGVAELGALIERCRRHDEAALTA